jgi:dTDP-4-dehydrorhamnose 3,5-epimerase
MQFTAGPVTGAFIVDLEERSDERGFFARAYAAEEFEARGLDPVTVQANISFNHRRGTLRGMHWQEPPHAETKLIRCTRGAVFDVVVDIRADSPTYLRWMAAELTADNRRAMYAPKGVAHGYLTLTDGAEVHYQVSYPFTPEADRGARWDDPAFAIAWPFPPESLSARDAAHPPFAVRRQSTP